MKATEFFKPVSKHKQAACGGSQGSLKIVSYKDGIGGGRAPNGRTFKMGGQDKVTDKKMRAR